MCQEKCKLLHYTIGENIDRLTITNIKIWHLEEKMSSPYISLNEKGEISDGIIKLNILREQCIESLNEYLRK